MTHQEFVSSAVNRKRYWARSLRGWRFFDQAQPNVAHRALGKLEQQGYVRTVVTQNVDGLHQRLGKEGWQRLGKPLPPREVRPFTCKALSAICGIDVRMSVRPISQFDDSRPRGLSVAREVCLSSMFQSFPSSFQPTPGRAARQRSSSCMVATMRFSASAAFAPGDVPATRSVGQSGLGWFSLSFAQVLCC